MDHPSYPYPMGDTPRVKTMPPEWFAAHWQAKQEAREQLERDLADGTITPEQTWRENVLLYVAGMQAVPGDLGQDLS